MCPTANPPSTVYHENPKRSMAFKLMWGSNVAPFHLCAIAAKKMDDGVTVAFLPNSTDYDDDDESKTGHPHTTESRAKISAANKGKQPWNVGRQHSEETKRKISEKTKAAMLQRKTAKALEMGLTLEVSMHHIKYIYIYISFHFNLLLRNLPS